MSGREILLLGATGRVGGLVARELCERGVRPRVLVRDSSRARQSLPDEVIPIVGDLAEPASLSPAVDGVDALLIVSPVHPDQRTLQRNIAAAAAAARNPLVVKISGLGTAPDSFVDSGRWHAQTEQEIRELGLPFTFLRPYFFMQNLGPQLAGARSHGVIRGSPGDPRIAMIDVRDLAAVAARLLVGEVDRQGEALDLSGPESLHYSDVAVQLSQALGREVAYQPQEPDALRATCEKLGMPAWHIDILLQFNRAFREGWAARTSDAVEQILERPPRSLANYLQEEAEDIGKAIAEDSLSHISRNP